MFFFLFLCFSMYFYIFLFLFLFFFLFLCFPSASFFPNLTRSDHLTFRCSSKFANLFSFFLCLSLKFSSKLFLKFDSKLLIKCMTKLGHIKIKFSLTKEGFFNGFVASKSPKLNINLKIMNISVII